MKQLVILSFFIGQSVLASVQVRGLGKSDRGQFIAIEEFGTKVHQKKDFSRITILNVWRNKVVYTNEIENSNNKFTLKKIRNLNKKKSIRKLFQYGIRPY